MNRHVRPAIDGWFSTEEPPVLLGRRCATCGTVVFPPTDGPCPNPSCDVTELLVHRLSSRGRIWSYTDAQYQPPPPYIPRRDPYQPFAIAAVELDDDGLVVLGQLADGYGVADVSVGTPVELVIEPLYESDGEEHVIWKWRPLVAVERRDV